MFSVLQGSVEALIRWGGKIYHLLITCFLSNISAKYYENPTMLSRVIAKNIGDVFLRHSVELGQVHFLVLSVSGSTLFQFSLGTFFNRTRSMCSHVVFIYFI